MSLYGTRCLQVFELFVFVLYTIISTGDHAFKKLVHGSELRAGLHQAGSKILKKQWNMNDNIHNVYLYNAGVPILSEIDQK